MRSTQRGLIAAGLIAIVGGQAQAQFKQVNLVSDGFVGAQVIDPHLVNPWGMAFSPTGPFWIANNGTGSSTVYDGNGTPFPPLSPLVVTIPSSADPTRSTDGTPTGIVFNPGGGFLVNSRPVSNSSMGVAKFIFASEDGTISGWAPGVDQTHAVVKVNTGAVTGGTPAVYKGLALSKWNGVPYLYATDFKSGMVHVYNSEWKHVRSFTDPKMEPGFAPFGIIADRNFLYVTYAKVGPDGDDVAGPGNGFVDIFLPNGHFVQKLVAHGRLNSPWGMAFAPRNWGKFAGTLLVGNFGDGTINAFKRGSGKFVGSLSESNGMKIKIDGLWAIAFGNGAFNSDEEDLYFTAGIGDEEHGLFGEIERIAE